ncbi:hypothetical protein CIB84_004480 [Bambusicola thoracicus]|uniref:Uncharacterized protein n=1 Tax=Bambusicola thoracicus TaxID=9083 RepID=A0A2P4T5X3_BAMTH|nr:hypothetical protein CIB84_004480 [Bambusicola thoracicus]
MIVVLGKPRGVVQMDQCEKSDHHKAQIRDRLVSPEGTTVVSSGGDLTRRKHSSKSQSLWSGKRIKKTRKYDIITTPAERVEMAPLNEEDDEDEDSTVFDVKYRSSDQTNNK